MPFKRSTFNQNNGQDTIRFEMTFDYGGIPRFLRSIFKPKFGKGKSELMSCALARPYKQLFEHGKPIGRINHIFFYVKSWPTHVLGSLCLTPGQQLLFYPGLRERQVNWVFSKRGSFKGVRTEFQVVKSTGLVDHLTLDKKLRRWHVTILGPKGRKELHLPSHRTKRIGKDALAWFGLTISDPNVLEITPEKLSLTFSSPPEDSKRRIRLLINARKDAILHLTSLDKMSLNPTEFLHFDFFTGSDKMPFEMLPCYAPTQIPIVHKYAQAFKGKTQFRRHPVSLVGMEKKVWVVASKHIGKLSDKAIVTCFEGP